MKYNLCFAVRAPIGMRACNPLLWRHPPHPNGEFEKVTYPVGRRPENPLETVHGPSLATATIRVKPWQIQVL
jgi:hypothetical protein